MSGLNTFMTLQNTISLPWVLLKTNGIRLNTSDVPMPKPGNGLHSVCPSRMGKFELQPPCLCHCPWLLVPGTISKAPPIAFPPPPSSETPLVLPSRNFYVGNVFTPSSFLHLWPLPPPFFGLSRSLVFGFAMSKL